MWEKVKLGKLSEIRTGKYDANHAVEDGDYPFYTCAIGQFRSNTYSFEGQLVILPGNGANVGEVMVYDGKIEAYQRTYVVHNIKSYLNFKFLYFFLKASWKNHVLKKQVGSATNYFKYNDLAGLEIPLPPFPIQEKIATILDKADELRRKDKELQSKYDELAQAIFIDMFGDPVRNEKGWEVKKLEELCSKILSGNTPKGGSEVYVESGIKFFRSQNVWKNRLDLDDIAYIDEATHKKMKNTSLKNKDILITKTGRINTENSSLGRAALYSGENDSANLNGHVYLIRVYSKFIIPEFLVFILTTIQYRDHIRSVCVGGIDKRQLNKEHIQDFPIILPPLHLQQSFARKIELINQLKAQANAEKSEELFQSLLQKAFKGELVS